MSCPLNRNRFKGSGYVKQCDASAAAKEMDARLKEMMSAREAQDRGVFAPVARPTEGNADLKHPSITNTIRIGSSLSR